MDDVLVQVRIFGRHRPKLLHLSLFQAFFEHGLVWTNGLTGRKKCLTAWLFSHIVHLPEKI